MPQLLIHTARDTRRVLDADDIYYLYAEGDDTRVRRRGARPLRDVRELSEVARALGPRGFLRIHRAYVVNPRYVLEIRKRKRGQDWELKLAPPVNRVLPISRDCLEAVWGCFGEG